MKILYISNHALDAQNGVVSKIKSQSKVWAESGHEVLIFSTQNLVLSDAHGRFIDEFRLSRKLLRYTGPIKFILMHILSFATALRFSPDVIYSRFYLFSPFFSMISFRFRHIMEINGDDIAELKSGRRWLHIYNLITRKLTLVALSGFVFVSDELSEKFSEFQKPSITIANGIDLPFSNEVQTHQETDSRVIHVGFTGTANQGWHGLDKILQFCSKYPEIHLHVVGYSGKNDSKVSFYGRVSTEQNRSILSQCSTCISSVAMHRAGLHEASPLKSREYVLLGKKIIYAYKDTDLDPWAIKFPHYFLKLPNVLENVVHNEDRIMKFIKDPLEPEDSSKIRNIGISVLSYSAKEETRLKFFKKIS